MATPTIESMRRLERACTRFEAVYDPNRDSLEPLIDPLLAEVEPQERNELLREMLAIDVELRQRRGLIVNASDYQTLLDRDDVSVSAEDLQRVLEGSRVSQITPASARYQFIEKVGSGGNGDVWRVMDLVGVRTLAVKRLRDSHHGDAWARARLIREALLTGRLQHPGAPPVYDHGELDDGAPFFSMKLIEGETFESTLRSRSDDIDDISRQLGIFEQVTQTVAYAHSQGIIHRDLKPQNVMVGPFGEVQVMDWGMAKERGTSESLNNAQLAVAPKNPVSLLDTIPSSEDESWAEVSRSLTMAGDILGTPAYMSPEQARGMGKTLDARSDVFTLGAILFEILTRTRLHQDCSVGEAIRRSAMGEFEDARERLMTCDADDELTAICRECLNYQPEDRFADAGELSDRITRHIVDVERRARQATIEQRESAVKISEDQKRRRLQTRAAVLVTLISLIGGGFAFWQRGRAVEANANTAIALQLADRRLKQSQSVVDEFLSKVADDDGVLTRTSGAQALRRDLLNKAVDYYEAFLSESEQDPELRFKVARAHSRLGETYLLLAPGGDDIVQHATKAIEICGDLMNESHQTPEHLECITKAYGLMSRSSKEADRNDEAYETGVIAQNFARQLAEQRGTTEDHFLHAYYLGQVGMIQHWRRKHDESAPLLREAIQIATPIQAAHPSNAKYHHQVSGMHSNLGISHGWGRGEWPQCLAELETAVRFGAAAVDLDPGRPDYRSDLAGREMNLAMALTHARRLDEAEQTFRSAIANHERLVRDNPLAIEPRTSLANACANFSTFCIRHINRSDFAVEFIQKSVAQYERLCESNPDIRVYVDRYTNGLIDEAILRVHASDAKDWESIVAVSAVPIDRAIECWRTWCENHPRAIDLQKKRLSWMAIRLDTDPTKLVRIIEELDSDIRQRKMQDDGWTDTRALAFLRQDQDQEAVDLLSEQRTATPSRQRMLIQAIALVESDPPAAQSHFAQALDGFEPDTTPDIAELLLFREAERKLGVSSPK